MNLSKVRSPEIAHVSKLSPSDSAHIVFDHVNINFVLFRDHHSPLCTGIT